ncbi:C6 zinc finger domain protein [Aspergillus heteromorphus CBS 117.55]|uniref:C6 zinc finger domain protein n=1 Tax=Aspergillus heteromorphus CBS 117.55 TaxID=1448321 RepID=A0A317UXJ9_9EURO|nr:C6 zinc finger domain protein [Aspergillus heteromorphus CBS 117.55]PWY66764.1 C6 zinc finger domain protein [Aspergillus heteromorphus CBS 117.55]
MPNTIPIAAPKISRTPRKRSKTGCRTCRARRVKCDETPGACIRCTSTGRKCDGYDVHRLPLRKPTFLIPPNPLMRYCGPMGPDERRGFSYFRQRVVPGLVGFFDSPLWQRHVLQMSQAEPAVCHAVNMLSAIYQDAEANRMTLTGDNLGNAQHAYALEQASRSFALLSKRRASSDPQLRQVTLLCCLLFVLSELLLGRYDSAFVHLRNGMQIVRYSQHRGERELPFMRPLVDALIYLHVQSAHFVSVDVRDALAPEQTPSSFLSTFHTVEDARQTINQILKNTSPFLAYCWRLSEAEKTAQQGELWRRQQELLFLLDLFNDQLTIFHAVSHRTLTPKDQRGAEMVRLQYLSQRLAVEDSLTAEQDLPSLTPQHLAVLSACEALMERFPERPAFTIDLGFIQGLHTVATKCADLRVRVRAVQALHAWPHCEGILNTSVSVALATRTLKTDLQRRQLGITDIPTAGDEDRFLMKLLTSTQFGPDWSTVRDAKIQLDDSSSTDGNTPLSFRLSPPPPPSTVISPGGGGEPLILRHALTDGTCASP